MAIVAKGTEDVAGIVDVFLSEEELGEGQLQTQRTTALTLLDLTLPNQHNTEHRETKQMINSSHEGT